MVLMQNIPEDYDLEELKTNLMKYVPEILDIHEVVNENQSKTIMSSLIVAIFNLKHVFTISVAFMAPGWK